MKRALIHVIIVTAAVSGMAVAYSQSVPDFSGTWKLDTAKGRNLGMVAAIQETVKITQTPENMAIDVSSTFQGKTSKRLVSYDLGGKPTQNESAMGDKSETVAKWDGDKLVVTWTAEGAVAGTMVTRTETRALSADGKTMTVAIQRGTNAPMELVYEKQ